MRLNQILRRRDESQTRIYRFVVDADPIGNGFTVYVSAENINEAIAVLGTDEFVSVEVLGKVLVSKATPVQAVA